MDSDAIRAQIRSELVNQFHEVEEAKEFVAPMVGKLAVACDSAEGVYKATLELMGVNTKGVHPSAYKELIKMKKEQGMTSARFASDSADTTSFVEKYGAPRKV